VVPILSEIKRPQRFQKLALAPTLDKFFEGNRDGLFLGPELPDPAGLFEQGVVNGEVRGHDRLRV
jgi:hypothetical protein